MCYSAKDSIIGFVSCVLGAILLLRIGYKHHLNDYKLAGIFFLFISLMQLFDYLFWTNPEATDKNKLYTKLAVIANHLQPIVLIGLAYIFDSKLSQRSWMFISLYILFTIPYTLKSFKEAPYTLAVDCSTDTCNGHSKIVQWNWNHLDNANVVYGLFLACFVSIFYDAMQSNSMKWMMILLSVSSLAFTSFKYKLSRNEGRMWCYVAAFMPWVVIGNYYFNQK
jgi:hypothetical protein